MTRSYTVSCGNLPLQTVVRWWGTMFREAAANEVGTFVPCWNQDERVTEKALPLVIPAEWCDKPYSLLAHTPGNSGSHGITGWSCSLSQVFAGLAKQGLRADQWLMVTFTKLFWNEELFLPTGERHACTSFSWDSCSPICGSVTP